MQNFSKFYQFSKFFLHYLLQMLRIKTNIDLKKIVSAKIKIYRLEKEGCHE